MFTRRDLFLLSLDINQFEDPREVWRKEQEEMIREYVDRGHDDLDVSTCFG